MVSTTPIVTPYNSLFLALATMIGLSVLILAICFLFLGVVWIAVLGVSVLIAHTTSIQLLLMLVVGYEIYRLSKCIKGMRYHL
jgi:hypothetical protein